MTACFISSGKYMYSYVPTGKRKWKRRMQLPGKMNWLETFMIMVFFMKRRTCSHGEGEGDGGRQESMLKRGGKYTKRNSKYKSKANI